MFANLRFATVKIFNFHGDKTFGFANIFLNPENPSKISSKSLIFAMPKSTTLATVKKIKDFLRPQNLRFCEHRKPTALAM